MRFNSTLHYTNEEVPKVKEYLDSRQIEYTVRVLKSPTNRYLVNSIAATISTKEQIEDYHNFIIRMRGNNYNEFMKRQRKMRKAES